jgi:peroxiredoxin
MTAPSIGEMAPNASFKHFGATGIETLPSAQLFKDKKVLIIGVVGAFTPICTKKHLPDFIPYALELKQQALLDEIVCLCVADPFVLRAWGEAIGANEHIKMLTDNNAEFAKQLNLHIDLSSIGLGVRSNRYTLLVENGVIQMLSVEDNFQQYEYCSRASIEKLLGLG